MPVRTRSGWIAVGAIVIAVALTTADTAKAARRPQTLPRVRWEDPRIGAAIARGIERSGTFRRLIERIDSSDGLVFVTEGRCGRSVNACLHHSLQVAGPYRLLRILVDLRKHSGCRLTASIGHELQHALEALDNPRVRDTTDLFQWFRQIGPTNSGTFETDAARLAELDVDRETC